MSENNLAARALKAEAEYWQSHIDALQKGIDEGDPQADALQVKLTRVTGLLSDTERKLADVLAAEAAEEAAKAARADAERAEREADNPEAREALRQEVQMTEQAWNDTVAEIDQTAELLFKRLRGIERTAKITGERAIAAGLAPVKTVLPERVRRLRAVDRWA